MKKLLLLITFFLLVIVFNTNAQYDKWINYQTIVRDNSGKLMASKSVTFKISILKTSVTGTVVYSETHVMTTTALGLANLEIGNGSAQTGSFSTIAWGSDKYFLKVELDANGGGFVAMGTTEILNVPRSFYAEKVGTIENNQVGDAQIQDMSRSVTVPAGALSVGPASLYASRSQRGITMKSTASASCNGLVAIPSDWDGVSNITIDLIFSNPSYSTALSGVACFFISVTGHNLTENFTDPGTNSSAGINVNGGTPYQMYKQTFSVPLADIAGKEYLHFYAIQRGGTGETCTADVELIAIKINYTAKR